MLDSGTCLREAGPLGPRLSSSGEQERNAVMANRVGGSICCSSVMSPTPSHTQPFQIKWEVYFSKNCVARLYCVVVMILHASAYEYATLHPRGVEASSEGINGCHSRKARLFEWIELSVDVKRIYVKKAKVIHMRSSFTLLEAARWNLRIYIHIYIYIDQFDLSIYICIYIYIYIHIRRLYRTATRKLSVKVFLTIYIYKSLEKLFP